MSSRAHHLLLLAVMGVPRLGILVQGRKEAAVVAALSPSAIGDETKLPLHLTKEWAGGTVTLDSLWFHRNEPKLLRIHGHFTGGDPRQWYDVSNRIREEKDGFESGGFSWYMG